MSDAATLWGSGTCERIAERFTPVDGELVRRLGPARDVRRIDPADRIGAPRSYLVVTGTRP